MTLKIKLIVFLYVVPAMVFSDYYRDRNNAAELPKRVQQLMINYNDRGAARVKEIMPMRAHYEETPHFELGYVVSEILERYRKMVGHVKKSIDYQSDVLFETIKQTELIQKLYLEIYHLVNMVNEIPRKYSHMREFLEEPSYDSSKVEEANRIIEEHKKNRERERKKRIKEMKKQRELYIKGQISFIERKPRKPANKWWPIDYGWEIDYYW